MNVRHAPARQRLADDTFESIGGASEMPDRSRESSAAPIAEEARASVRAAAATLDEVSVASSGRAPAVILRLAAQADTSSVEVQNPATHRGSDGLGAVLNA